MSSSRGTSTEHVSINVEGRNNSKKTEKEGRINSVVEKSRTIQEVLNQPIHLTNSSSALSHDDNLKEVKSKIDQNKETISTAGKDINEAIVHMQTMMSRQHKFQNFDFPTAIMHFSRANKDWPNLLINVRQVKTSEK